MAGRSRWTTSTTGWPRSTTSSSRTGTPASSGRPTSSPGSYRTAGGPGESVLDASCGIGTQAIGLARRGFAVTASDPPAGAVERAGAEARRRGVEIDLSVADMRSDHDHHRRQFDVVMSCDNSVPRLLTDDEILLALRRMHTCTRPGGGCLITVRDYDREERGTGIVKHYGVREAGGVRHVIFQVWDFDGEVYDLAMYLVVDDCGGQ